MASTRVDADSYELKRLRIKVAQARAGAHHLGQQARPMLTYSIPSVRMYAGS